MPPKAKSTQKDIIETAMQIVRGQTIEAVTSGDYDISPARASL